MVGRMVDRAFDNPAMSGGLVVMAITAMAIVSNALFLQSHRHPDPLFMQRPAIEARPAVPIPKVRPGIAANVAVDPAPPAENVGAEAALVVHVQRELARLGLYSGPIDGIPGARTRAAIGAYQSAAGLPPTGAASAELLAYMTGPGPRVAPTAPPTPEPAAAPAGTIGDLAAGTTAPADDGPLYRRVQTALNLAGYGPIAVDGQPGRETADAIRRFELDNGLSVTGEIGDRLVARLVAIGAMQAM